MSAYGRAYHETACERSGTHLRPRALKYERNEKVTIAHMVCDECGARWTKEERRRPT